MNIAIISPSKNAYSETFIQAHKERLKGNIFYYHQGHLPAMMDSKLLLLSRINRLSYKIRRKLGIKKISLGELSVIQSFKENKIDLIFAEYGPTGMQLLKICKTLKLPLIVHFHGYDASREDLLKRYNNYRELFESASYLIVVSRKMERDLLALGCPREKLVYNVYGPAEEFLMVNPTYSKLQFIAIGRFVNKKAPYYLILSFKEVVKQFPEARLIMAGEGELWNTCKNIVRYYGLEDHISFPGVIDREAYINYLKDSIAIVQHSITAADGDSEGTPVAILEASAAGLPVISTKHAGIPDVITDGKTGLLVEEHDVKAMAESMLKLLIDQHIVRELGQNGKKNITENFTLERHIKVLDELIAKVLLK